MKKLTINLSYIILVILFLLCLTPTTPRAAGALSVGNATVISSKCDVYSSPSFSADKLSDENDNTVSLKHSDLVEIIDLEGDFALIKISQSQTGYVYKYYLTQTSPQTVYPVFNATIRRDTSIFDIDKMETSFTAKQNKRAYLFKGFVNEDGYVALQIVLEDGSLYNGYVKIEDVKPDGVSGLLIVGISIIAAGVTIILSLIFIKKTKKAKKKTKKAQKST